MSSGNGDLVDLTQSFDENDVIYNGWDDDLPDIESGAPSWRSSTVSQTSVSSTVSSVNSSTTSGGSNRNKTRDPLEVARKNAEKEQKRREKEEEKARKHAKKEELAREREEKKRLKEAEKAEKVNSRVVVRSKRPGECMKYVTVLLEQSILQTGFGAKLLPLLHDSEVQYRFEKFAIDKLISWQREAPCDSQASSTTDDDPPEESQVLMVVPVNDFVQYVHASATNAGDVTLSLFVSQLQDNLPDKDLTIAVQGLEKYFRDVKTLNQRQYRQNVLNAAGAAEPAKKGAKKLKLDVIITRLELEQALVTQELETNVNFKFLESDEELAKLVLMMTKGTAEAPFKRSRHEVDFSFLPDNKNVVKVNKDGQGLMKLWTNQFLQFNNVSPDMAKAIVAEFTSPMHLMQAYSNAPSQRDAELLLADIRVRRGAGVLETSRRIGKELSRRIHEYLTSDDPNHVLK